MRTAYADFENIENHFDEQDIDYQMKAIARPQYRNRELQDNNSQESVKFDHNTPRSPKQVERQYNGKPARISFGCQNSLQLMMAQRSNQNSIQSSLQLEAGIQDTAQFSTKFQRRFTNMHSSIEELSAEHTEPSMIHTACRKKDRQNKLQQQNLTITTEQEIQDLEAQSDNEWRQQISSDQMEDYMVKLIEEMKRQQQEMQYLSMQIERQKSDNKRQMLMNTDFCQVIEQTQHQMMVLAKENQYLKKQCSLVSTQDTEPRITTFLTLESDYNSKKENNPHRANKKM